MGANIALLRYFYDVSFDRKLHVNEQSICNLHLLLNLRSPRDCGSCRRRNFFPINAPGMGLFNCLIWWVMVND